MHEGSWCSKVDMKQDTTTTLKKPDGALESIEFRLHMVFRSAVEAAHKAALIGDMVFGAPPQTEDKSKQIEPQSHGTVSQINARLNDIDRVMARLHDVLARLDDL